MVESVSKYKTMAPDNVKSEWTTKEQARQLTVSLQPAPRIHSYKDKELKKVLESLEPDPSNPYASQMQGLHQQVEGIQQSLNSLQETLNGLTGTHSNSLTSRFGQSFNDLLQQLPDQNEGSKLTDEKKSTIKRLVDEGASLQGIDALHLAAASYKERDLFDLLIDEYDWLAKY